MCGASSFLALCSKHYSQAVNYWSSCIKWMWHWRQMFIVCDIYIFFKTPSTEIGWNYHHKTQHLYIRGLFWSLTCGNSMWQYTHGYTFFFYWQDGWSFSNCAQAETTAELHQGLLLNFLKKTHVLEEKGDGVGWGGRDGNGGRGIGKKNLGRKPDISVWGGACFVMPHMECFGSVSNKYFSQKSLYSKSLHIIPQGESYKDIAVRV